MKEYETRQLFTIRSEIFAYMALRTITGTDCNSLRRWKNTNRKAFFFQNIISPQMQAQWFKNYLDRKNDFMFMVMFHNEPIGCIGFRIIEDQADIYNVILGRPNIGGKGLMSKAIRLMCSYIYSDFTHDIRLKVLHCNPAVGWYEKNGFYKTALYDTYFEMKLHNNAFHPCRFKKVVLHGN